jgi:transitional endoplasmic reticulum ATPase|eukprot:SAG25_NODE_1005_length_4341_cov_11.722301_2_plen_813_part_00
MEDQGAHDGSWQPSAYWSSTATSGSDWFSSWAEVPSPQQREPRSSKGMARSSARFGSDQVGIPDGKVDGSVSGGARSFNRFGSTNPEALAVDPAPPPPIHNSSRTLEPSKSTSKRSRETSSPPPPVLSVKHGVQKEPSGAGLDYSDEQPLGYESLAGCESAIGAARKFIELPLTHPEFFRAAGSNFPGAVLVHGPTGVGKTLLVQAAAAAAGANLVVLNGSEVVGEQADASKDLRKSFIRARQKAPCVLFLDEVDVIAPKQLTGSVSQANPAGVRLVSQLVALLDESTRWRDVDRVVVVAATNRPAALDLSLRRAGRLGNEIVMGIPSANARVQMLQMMISRMRVGPDLDLQALSNRTHGFTGADLAGMCDAAGMACLHEHFNSMDAQQLDEDRCLTITALDGQSHTIGEEPSEAEREAVAAAAAAAADIAVHQRHFLHAAEELGPSGMRELRVEHPDVEWEAVGGVEQAKLQLQRAIVWPLKYPARFKHFAASTSRGVLLFGPPGCGKTLLAKAVATECSANFISIQASDILTKFVGESEANVRELFSKARSVKPCVIFMDEIDAISSNRSGLSSDSNQGACDGVVSSLLSELDSCHSGVVIIGATNRPDKIDKALLRPGRLGTLCYVSIPNQTQRLAVLRASLRKSPLAPELSSGLEHVARATEGFSCADLNAICERAVKIAVRDAIKTEEMAQEMDSCEWESPQCLSLAHMEGAMQAARRSVSDEDAKWFDSVAEAVAAGLPLTSRPADGSSEHDIAALQAEVRDLVDEVKDISRWQRGWGWAKANAIQLLESQHTELREQWTTAIAPP